MPNIRKGSGYSWSSNSKALAGDDREQRGFTVDNLDTKQLNDAVNNYEKVFITVREVLKYNEQYCCDDENDRLSIAQVVADTLRQGYLIRKEGT